MGEARLGGGLIARRAKRNDPPEGRSSAVRGEEADGRPVGDHDVPLGEDGGPPGGDEAGGPVGHRPQRGVGVQRNAARAGAGDKGGI